MQKISLLSIPLVLASFISCNNQENNLKTAIEGITPDGMKTYISVLASDDFGGRAPASAGEEKTINYMAEQFKALGVLPAVNGSYFQEVSLVKLTTRKDIKLNVKGSKLNYDLKFSDDFIGGTPKAQDTISFDNSDMIFAGYGIDAPEFDWNDFKNTNVKGKTIVVMVNDPGYATGDTNLFRGKEMTYYGRWTYKYEEAARLGASAVLIIHETGAASYPWEVVRNSWGGPRFSLENDELSKSDLMFHGWITTDVARKLFESAGLDYETLTKAASQRGFSPVDMKLKTSVHMHNDVAHTKSNNVAAYIPGGEKPDEFVIYSAHWDHFGINNSFKGDSILNGALDNATGTAALLELAKAYKGLKPQQKRSVLFLAVTCEEQGLLGSQYYAEHPLFPLNKTVADINMDGLNILGPSKDMTISGYGYSGLDKFAIDVLKKNGRYASPDPNPERGGYFRSDHFSFAKVGVPSLNLAKGADDAVHGKEWGIAQAQKWTMDNYHKPGDNYEPDKWNFEGMIDDIRVYFEVGYNLCNTDEFPNWTEGIQFKATRDKMMEGK